MCGNDENSKYHFNEYASNEKNVDAVDVLHENKQEFDILLEYFIIMSFELQTNDRKIATISRIRKLFNVLK